MTKRYKMKVLPVEAIQWTGDNVQEVKDFCRQFALFLRDAELYIRVDGRKIYVVPGEFIVRRTNGSFYPLDKHVFEETYEEV